MRVLRLASLLLTLTTSMAPHAFAADATSVTITAAQRQALGIQTQAIQPMQQGAMHTLPGQVVVPNGQLRVVSAPAAGLIEELRVVTGESVRKGQVLAVMASPEVLGLQRDYLQIASQADLAKRALNRDESLYQDGIIALSRLEASRAAWQQALAALNERRNTLRIAGVTPGDAQATRITLTSPIDGEVLEQGATVGQRVDNSALIFRIGRLSPLWLELQAPAALARQFQIGTSVTVGEVRGTLTHIGRAVGNGQTVVLRARVDKGGERLNPGQHIEATLIDNTPTQTSASAGVLTRLPNSALVRQGKQAAGVFVETPQGFQLVTVSVEGDQQGEWLVRGPFKASDKIAVRGVSALKASLLGVGKE